MVLRSALSNVANQSLPTSPARAARRKKKGSDSCRPFRGSLRAEAGGASTVTAVAANATAAAVAAAGEAGAATAVADPSLACSSLSTLSTSGSFILGDSPSQKQRVVVRRAKRAKTTRRGYVGGRLNVPSKFARSDETGSSTPDVCPRAPNNTPAGAFTNAVHRRGEIKPTDLFVELFSHTSILQSSSEACTASCQLGEENEASVDKELLEVNNVNNKSSEINLKLLGKRMRRHEEERITGAGAPSDRMFSSCTIREGQESGGIFSCSLQ